MTTVTVLKRGFVVAVLHYNTTDEKACIDVVRMTYPRDGGFILKVEGRNGQSAPDTLETEQDRA